MDISYKVFRDWMKRGAKAKSGEFRDFRNAVLKAVALAETSVVALWQAHMPDNWQACRDFLARRFPKQWAERQEIKHKGKLGLEMEIVERVIRTREEAAQAVSDMAKAERVP